MKRTLLVALAAALTVALAVSAVTFARGGADDRASSAGSRQGAAQPTAGAPVRRGARREHGAHGAMVLSGLAGRLGVTPAKLIDALRGTARRGLDRKVADGTITATQRDALAACVQRPRGSACDRATAGPAARALKGSFDGAGPAALAALKRDIASDLAAELGKSAADVVVAVRAELADKLAKGVALGFVSDKARDLALGCFDTPQTCDRAALRAALPQWHGHRRHGEGRDRGHARAFRLGHGGHHWR